jgi:hypothetical protein
MRIVATPSKLTRTGAAVKTLWVPLLAEVQGCIYIDLEITGRHPANFFANRTDLLSVN